MGIVFQAEDDQLRRPAALKVMRPELAAQDDARVRFLREARAAAALKHDHIVTIYQVGDESGVPFLAMECLSGRSLEEWLRPDRRATVAETLTIGKQIAKGLAAAHQLGLIHRDIKPANLWLEAPRGRIKVLDFGLARQADGEFTVLTQEGAVVGTPAFMAPEQARGESVDPRCDLFSLGCVLFRMLTGRLPFQGNTLYAVLAAIATETPPPITELNPGVPPRLSTLISSLLAKSPDQRPASAQVVIDELQSIEREIKGQGTGAGASVTPSSAAATVPPITSAGRRRSIGWIVAATGLAVIVIGAVLLSRARRPSPLDALNNDETATAADDGSPAELAASALEEPETPDEAEGSTIPLLPLVDVFRDRRRGNWRLISARRLAGSSGKEVASLKLPYDPPPEYRFRATVIRMNKDPVFLGFCVQCGEIPYSVVFDIRARDRKDRPFVSGISSLNGEPVWQRSDAKIGRVFHRWVPAKIVCTVRPDHFTVELNGSPFYEWQGPARAVEKVNPLDAPLQLVIGPEGDFVFQDISVEPLSDETRPSP